MTRGALLLLTALLASPVAAQTLDFTQGGPIEITSDDGIEWRQQDQVVVANGNARATRDGVTIDADRLIARYRPRAGAPPRQQQSGAASPVSGSEIWRLEAEGNVRITSANERANGTRAVYDMDQAVMVLSGQGLALETPDQRITARDSLEYWPQRRMAVARGGAVVTTTDNRRITADTLVAYFLEAPPEGARPPVQQAAQPAQQPARQGGLPGLPGGGGEGSRIDRVEAFGDVEIRTPEEVVRGDRGVYSPQTGMARLLGNVRITRGDNQLNGQEAIVNLRSGIARLVSAPGQRVQGLIVPQQTQPGEAQVPPAGTPQGAARQPRVPRPDGAGARP
ncbi:LptA/OstA family protein [Roseomonas sp. AR75]|uniref:LptA/OstA family protein n=1 Tax=Roseomonas sp. AR75 TaxID=2562311 RepID=UPI0010C0B527|nr:LptA/OstA family protein [Roseomonas sp. AR75]